MRVLLILENAGAGTGRHVLDLADGLLAAGDDVHLLYSRKRLEPSFEEALAELSDLVAVPMAMERGPSRKDVSALREVRRYLKTNGPFDVVHGHSSKGGALARLAGVGLTRSVYTPHAFFTLNPDLGGRMRTSYTLAERLLGYLSGAVICVSEEEREHARDALGIAAARLHVVGHGLQPLPAVDRDEARAELGIAPGDLCIGFVGRLAAQKDIANLIDAFAGISSPLPGTRLVLVGSGELEGELRAHAAAAGLEDGDRIVFAGQRNGVRAMAAFDIFALGSRYEGFPYVFCEALCAGVPIVTTRVGGASEAVDEIDRSGEGRCGLIVPAGDSAALGGALSVLCTDHARRAQMATAAKARTPEFSIERLIAAIRDIYRAA